MLEETHLRKIFHDETLQDHFMKSGYARMPMLDAAEVARMLAGVHALRPADRFAPNGVVHSYHCSFLDANFEYKRQAFNLIQQVFAPHISQVLNGYKILNSNFYVKPPGTGEFVIHQNWPAIADLTDTTVTVWCPLVDVVESNGALQVVEGSHKLLPHVEGPNGPGYFRDFGAALIRRYLKPIPMSAGEAIIFDDGLIHWSANNDSKIPRFAIQILCVPSDAQPVYFFFDPKNPERFELIAVDSEFFITANIGDLNKRQPHWRSLGFVENRNRYLTEREFASLLAKGGAIRQEIYGLACR